MEMKLLINIGLFSAGLLLLYTGAELLVRGASRLAYLARVRPVIVGLTVVAIGTSFPEFLTSLVAAWQDKIDLAIGNIVGSNIANIGLILGISGLILPVTVHTKSVIKEFYWMIGASVVFLLFSLNGVIGHLEGLVLISGILLFTGILVRVSLEDRKNNQSHFTENTEHKWFRNYSKYKRLAIYLVMTIGGILMLMIGSDWLVQSATEIALIFGVSEVVIGLSLVAFGTSLPELATAIISLIKKENEILLGNIIGSNIFNLLFVGGILSSFFSSPIQQHLIVFDLPVMIAVSLMLAPAIFWSKRISRLGGLCLLIIYLAYLVYLFYFTAM